MTISTCTPSRPRSRSSRKNPVQNTVFSLSPTLEPRTSRRPSALTPVAMTTARTPRGPDPGFAVGRVEEHVGERAVVQGPGVVGGDLFVEAGADPRDLGLADSGTESVM